MKFTAECPICENKPSFTLKARIRVDNYRGVQRKVAAEYFKLSNETSPEEIVSFCTNCRAVYRAKFFDNAEVEKIYSSVYQSLEDKIYDDPGFAYCNEKFLTGCSEKMFAIVKDVEKMYGVKISDIFDIGGRDGFRLKTLANSGYKCKVFDPISCAVCDKNIHKERKWSHEINENEKADFIFLCNVLEHSIDPYKMIMDCYSRLREGGFLYVELPSDIETVFDWIFFSIWRNGNLTIDNTHYIFYSKRSIIYLLESIGFDCVRCRFSILPEVKVNVMEALGQKKSLRTSRLSRGLSFDFDLLGSGHFTRLFPRLINKIFRHWKVIL